VLPAPVPIGPGAGAKTIHSSVLSIGVVSGHSLRISACAK